MDLALEALTAAILVGLGCVYGRGWWRLRRDTGYEMPRWRLWLYFAGLASVAAALLSPIDDLAEQFFMAHMIQHLLLTMTAAPLLMLGNPLLLMLWGLPPRARHALARPLTRGGWLRRLLQTLTLLPVAWLVHVAAVWLWHFPALYDAALEHDIVHALEHLTFFTTALLFWWPIVSPAPRLHRAAHPGFKILYLVAATAQNTLLGMILTMPERPFYRHYEALATKLGRSAIDDQMLAGGIMWMGGHMYLFPILIILWNMAQDAREDEVPA